MEQSTNYHTKDFWQWIFHPFLFPLLAFASWLSCLLFFPADFALLPSMSALPGEATQSGVDVGLRVGLFYKCFFLIFGITGLGLYWLRDWRDRDSPSWLQPWQAIAVSGVGLLWLKVMGSPQIQTEFFILSICFGLLLYQLAQRFQQQSVDTVDFFTLAALSMGLAFLLKITNGQFLERPRPFGFSWVLSFTLLYGMRIVLHKAKKVLLSHYTRLVLPLAFIPLLLVISQEFYFFINHYGLHALSPNMCFLMLLVIGLLSWIFLAEPRLAKEEWSQREYLDLVVLPVLLVGLIAFAQQAVFMKYPREIFELANGANGIMRWFHFGEWPIVEWLSSHLLYDIDVRTFYTAIYGYDGSLDFLAFDFIPKTLFALIGYSFLRRILQDSIIAFLLGTMKMRSRC